MSEMETAEMESIESADLSRVVGGEGYNWGDVVRGGGGALLGALTGGPVGAVVGFGAGFMSRNVSNLGDAVNDLQRERQRAQQLEQQRQQLINRPQQPQPPRR